MQPEKNYERAANFIRSAASQQADLVVLPEYHLLNWVPDEPGFKAACADWQTYVDRYCALAKECSINIVPGTILELHNKDQEDEALLNVAYFIDTHGEVLGRYVKKNLWGDIERLHLTSSSTDPHRAIDTPLGKVGILICWDLAFSEAWRELICQGVKIFIIPTFWTLLDCSEAGRAVNPTSEVLFLDSILTSRCFENTCGTYKLTLFKTEVIKADSRSCNLCKCRWTSKQRLRRSLSGVRSLCRTPCPAGQLRRRHGRCRPGHGHC